MDASRHGQTICRCCALGANRPCHGFAGSGGDPLRKRGHVTRPAARGVIHGRPAPRFEGIRAPCRLRHGSAGSSIRHPTDPRVGPAPRRAHRGLSGVGTCSPSSSVLPWPSLSPSPSRPARQLPRSRSSSPSLRVPDGALCPEPRPAHRTRARGRLLAPHRAQVQTGASGRGTPRGRRHREHDGERRSHCRLLGHRGRPRPVRRVLVVPVPFVRSLGFAGLVVPLVS